MFMCMCIYCMYNMYIYIYILCWKVQSVPDAATEKFGLYHVTSTHVIVTAVIRDSLRGSSVKI